MSAILSKNNENSPIFWLRVNTERIQATILAVNVVGVTEGDILWEPSQEAKN